MSKSLRWKFVFIMLLLVVLLMTVVSVFLMRGVQDFYTEEFYKQMQTVFANNDMAASLTSAASSDDAAQNLQDVLSLYAGRLGIDADTRNFYILNGKTGAYLRGSSVSANESLEMTPNILTALAGGSGYAGDPDAGYMDVAIPVSGGASDTSYIIYIKDNKQTVQTLNRKIYSLILNAVVIGSAISVAISIVLSSTMLQPIRGMTKAAEEMADGNFSRKIDVQSNDEIGILADTFNTMASQLEATLEEIKKSESMKRELVANVSHELRTPITSIRSYVETLIDNQDMSADMEENFLHVILQESERMTKIIQDLLELSKFDSGNSQFTIEKFSLEQSIRDAVKTIALEAQKHGHDINLELEWKLPWINGDKARIEQVLLNIMMNAVKYTPDGGIIDISGGSGDGKVWVKVQDNGVGIPKDDIPRIFDRFYRVEKARSRESGGTGLGLSIAKEIVTKHGGEIIIESDVGEGTIVTVVLPVEGPPNE